jgi:methylamine utilization protein MauE/thioredoxin family protein
MVDIDLIARAAVGLVLLWAAGAKLAARDPGRLEPYGLPTPLRTPLYFGLALAEAAVGVLLLVGVRYAPLAAIALGVLFTLALARARARGIRRLECGCFGARERSTDALILRALAFTGLAGIGAVALEPSLPSRETFVLVAVAVLAALVLVLAALVLALYRQVGILTLRVGPGVALELAEEGPPAGEPAPELEDLTGVGPELAVFFSPGCRLCRELAPAVRALANDGLPVHVVYEDDEPDAFERWRVPGTPFAVHVVGGIVVAKGAVNTLEQLEELVAVGAARAERAAA